MDTDARDVITGKRKLTPAGLPWLRPPETCPPCEKCPKGGPENEHLYELTHRAKGAIGYHRMLLCGSVDPRSLDGIALRCYEIIAPMLEEKAKKDAAAYLAIELFPLIKMGAL